MKLFNKEEYENAKVRDLLDLSCDHCGNNYQISKRNLKLGMKRGYKNNFCSKQCQQYFLHPRIIEQCKNCKTTISKTPSELSISKNPFCSKSCAAIYNNTHKTKGTRRSKLEAWLEEQLPTLYPDLEFHFNCKDAINSELDIYIPSLNLAFELNGIFHYEPIFGESKLDQIQNNDNRKFQACLERGIELCIIDTSSQTYFKEKSSKKYLDIITNLVNSKLESSKTDYVEVL